MPDAKPIWLKSGDKWLSFPAGTPPETIKKMAQQVGGTASAQAARAEGVQPSPDVVDEAYKTLAQAKARIAAKASGADQALPLPDVTPAPDPKLSAPDARNVLALSDKTGIGPGVVRDAAPDIQRQELLQDYTDALDKVPRLKTWAAQSPAHASAIQDSHKDLGILGWVLGGEYEPVQPRPDDAGMSELEDLARPGQYEKQVEQNVTPPGWELAIGQGMLKSWHGISNFFRSTYGAEKDSGVPLAELKQQQDTTDGVPLPGEDGKVGKVLYGGERALQGVVPFVLNPALGLGVMHAETVGNTYKDLRLQGYEHEEAVPVAHMVGTVSTGINYLLGQGLFGTFLPKTAYNLLPQVVQQSLGNVIKQFPKSTSFLTKTLSAQFSGMLMSVGASAAEEATKEAFDSYRAGRSFNVSSILDKIKHAFYGSFALLPVSLLHAAGHSVAHLEYGDTAALDETFSKLKATEIDRSLPILQNYERIGLALGSIRDATRLRVAADAVKRSAFMQDNPALGKELVRHLIAPGMAQSVWVDPVYLMNLPHGEKALLSDVPGLDSAVEESAHTGVPVEVPLEAVLTHPSADKLIEHSSTSPDQPMTKDAGKWLTEAEAQALYDRVPGEGGVSLPLAGKLTPEQLGAMRIGGRNAHEATAPGRGQARGNLDLPEPESQGYFDPILKTEQVPNLLEVGQSLPTGPKEKAPKPPPPMLGFRGKLTAERLKAWSAEQVEGVQIGSLKVKQRQHQRNADSAETSAVNLQKQATETLAKATKRGQESGHKGIEGSKLGQTGIKDALAGDRVGAVEAFDDVTDVRREADKQGAESVRREVHAGDKVKEVEKHEKIAKVNRAMEKAAAAALEEAGKIKRFIERHNDASHREDIYKAGHEYGQVFDAIMESLGLAKQRGAAAPNVSDLALKLRNETQYDRLRTLPNENQDANLQNFQLPEEGATKLTAPEQVYQIEQKLYQDGNDVLTHDERTLLNKLFQVDPSQPGRGGPTRGARGFDDLTLAEGRTLRSALNKIVTAAKAKRQVQLEGEYASIDQIRDDLGAHLGKLPDADRGNTHSFVDESLLGAGEEVKLGAKRVRSVFDQPVVRLLKWGEVGRKLWGEFVGGRNNEERMNETLAPEFKRINESIPPEIQASANDKMPRLPGQHDIAEIPRSSVWRLALHLGTSDGIDKIARGLKTTPAELISYVQDNLGRTPAESTQVMESVIQPLWKMYSDMWEGPVQTYYRKQGKAPPAKLDAVPFTLHGKTYSGGYGGRLRWLDGQMGIPAQPGSMLALLGFNHNGSAPTSETGSLNNERTDVAIKPDLAWSGVFGSFKSEVHELSYAPFVQKLHTILSDEGIRKILDDKIGKDEIDGIYKPGDPTSWLATVARGRVQDVSSAGAVTRIISNLTGRAATQAFVGNLKVLGMQLSHIPAMKFGMNIPTKHIIAAGFKVFDPEAREWAHQNSKQLPYRHNDFERHNIEMNAELTGHTPGAGIETRLPVVGGAIGATQKFTAKVNYAIWQQMDSFLSHWVWEAKRLQAESEGADPWAAREAADDAVQRGMPAQSIYEKAALVNDKQLRGLLFLVSNFPDTLLNVNALNNWNAKLARYSGGGLWQRHSPTVGATIRGLGMLAAAELLGKGMWHLPTGDDGDTVGEWIVRKAAGMLAYQYEMGPVAEAAVALAQGNKKEARHQMQQWGVGPAPGLVGRGLDDLGTAVMGEDDKQVRSALDALGLGIGLPLQRAYDYATPLMGE